MTERIRRTWRRTSPFGKPLLILMIALGSGAFLAFALDADSDGIDDGYEMFFGLNATTNDAALDSDGDNLSNYAESLLWTDPLIADTDRDGFPDGVDSNPVSRAWVPWGESLFARTNEMIYTWPPWMVSAFKAGGEWNTNIPAWDVAALDANPASLNMEVDRDLLTNNLRMRMDYVDQSNATIFLDLYDTNEVTVASNLLDNLLTGGGSLTTRTFAIPLAAYTNAVGIRLRRESGAVSIRDNLLYVDEDGDGLDAEQERQLGASDHDVDTDHDGFSDYEEVFTYGTDPASALSVPFGLLMGQVAYAGVQTGLFHIVAAADTGSWTSSCSATVSAPGAYSIFAPQRRTYFVKAFRDVNGNGSRDYWEPCGTAVPLSVYLTTATTGGVDIALNDPDSDGDGMSDVVELALGLNPYVSNSFARLPFLENFETNTVHLGDVNGQNGWMASPSNTVLVQTGVVWEGAQALMLKPGDASSSVCQMFAMSNAPVVWADAHILAWAGSAPTNPVSGSAMAFFDDNGYLRVYDGLSASTNKWVALTNVAPHAMTGEWVRLTMKLDYGVHRWLACVDGVLAGEGLGFASPVSQFNMVSLKGERGGMDALCVSTNQPAGLSLDGDQIPDDWEQTNFGNLVQTDNGDADGDGLSNLEEFRHVTDPNVADSDHDGMSDGWEVAHGLNPTSPADAALDADGDGLSNLGECAAGTDPRNAASHCWSISGTLAYTGPQTGLIWIAACTSTTGWTVVSQASAVSAGAYVIANVPPASNYWVKAWRDTDGNGSNDFWEACGAYTNHSISLFTNITGINFVLSDPDSDGDGMPDWWEIANGFNPTNAADALQDADGDGLSNRAEYSNGTDPHLADTDHDGIADGLEVQSGSNPKMANNFAQFPFIERFETNTVHLGDVNGQNGWIATSSNTVMVQTGVVWEGSQALSIKAGDTPSSVCQLFRVSNAPVVWADARILAWPGSAPTSPVSGSAMAFFDDNGYLKVYDGLSASTNKWLALTNVVPHAMTGEWVRLTMKLDYNTQRWLACVDGILAREGIGFATVVSQFNMVSLKGERGGMDALCVSTNEPAGLSLDGDLMPDDWERANFGNLDQTDDGDPDHDGLSNLEEYRQGTDPGGNGGVATDTDHDGIPDSWEIQYGFNPTNAADAAMDADGDGIGNGDEYLRATDPTNAASINITLYVDSLHGDDANRGLDPVATDVRGPLRTIPAAITAARRGDSIQVAAGQYAGGGLWSVRNKAIRLEPKGMVIVK